MILLGQVRRKDVVDSLKAPGNLQRAQGFVNSYRGANVENIAGADSGDYVTLTVRIYVPVPAGIVPAAMAAYSALTIRPIAHPTHRTIPVPPLPPVIPMQDSIPPMQLLTVNSFPVSAPAQIAIRAAAVPPMPFVQPYIIVMMQLLPATQFRIRDLIFSSAQPRIVPPTPYVQPYLIANTHPISAVQFRITDVIPPRGHSTPVPALPEVECWTIFPVPGIDASELTITRRPAQHMDTVFIHPFREEKFEVEGMHLSDEGYALLEKMEGFSPDLYILGDGGYTIGFGFFIPYSDKGKWHKSITMEEGEQLMRQKMPTYEDQVKQYINTTLTQREFDALVMLAYNLGGFSRATSIVNDINSQAGFDKLQADWNRFIHSKAPGVTRGLMNRRRDELGVRNEANYQRERKIQVIGQRRQ